MRNLTSHLRKALLVEGFTITAGKQDDPDYVQVLNQNGRKVWILKETLKGPEGKKYKPVPKAQKGGRPVKVPDWLADKLENVPKDFGATNEAKKPIYYAIKNSKPVTEDMVKNLSNAIAEDFEDHDWSGEPEKVAIIKELEQWASGPKKPKTEKPKTEKPKKTYKKNYRPQMESVMDKHGLTDEDAKAVIEFSIDRPRKGRPVSDAELMRRFKAKASPETKERMKDMTPKEFKIMLRAILDKDEEEGVSKTASLQSGLIRLAYAKPELRSNLLPLLKDASSGPTYKEYVERKHKEGEQPLSEEDWEARVKGRGQKQEQGGSSKALSPSDSKTLSEALGQWYESASDPIYAVSSMAASGKPISSEAASAAHKKIKSMLDNAEAFKLSDADKKQLSSAQTLLEKVTGGSSKSEKPKKTFRKNYRPKMEAVMSKHGLTDEDAKAVIEFSTDRPRKGKEQPPAVLMQRFMAKASPETKERMKGMTPDEFKTMLRAIMDQDEGEVKMAHSRSSLIRLAYANPEMRSKLLPLLDKRADYGIESQAKKVVEGLARLLAAKVGGTVGGVNVRSGDSTLATVEVKVPNLPSITSGGDEDAAIAVELSVYSDGGVSIHFQYVLYPPHLKTLAYKVANISVTGDNLEEVVQKAINSMHELPALLTPYQDREALRRQSSVAFKRAIPDMKEWLQKAIIQSGVVGPLVVWGHPHGSSGVFTTMDGTPFAVERVIIEGLLTKGESRDVQRSKEVLVNTRKVLTKALARFSSNGVVAKLSSKPASWSSSAYNTTVILYFKDAPVANMKLAGEDSDPKSKDQNKPEHYYGLPPKGVQAGQVKAAAGPDPKGRNWKAQEDSGLTHWTWKGAPGDPIQMFRVIQRKEAVGTFYKMAVKLEDGTVLQTSGQKLSPMDWFKRAAGIYKDAQTALLDFSSMPEKWSRLSGGF